MAKTRRLHKKKADRSTRRYKNKSGGGFFGNIKKRMNEKKQRKLEELEERQKRSANAFALSMERDNIKGMIKYAVNKLRNLKNKLIEEKTNNNFIIKTNNNNIEWAIPDDNYESYDLHTYHFYYLLNLLNILFMSEHFNDKYRKDNREPFLIELFGEEHIYNKEKLINIPDRIYKAIEEDDRVLSFASERANTYSSERVNKYLSERANKYYNEHIKDKETYSWEKVILSLNTNIHS